MIISKVILNNIRSYKQAEISLGTGKILLSGDIGSGKSSILYAIEFALFGLLRGSINGSDLLRHGENEGSVLMEFNVGSNKYSIYRTLRRTSTGINQESGYLEINGQRENLVHTELKARILDIIGYPKNLLSKNKNMLFRYTSYTPQEEVKKIMQEDPETRLDILRKIFGIDKYKTVRENTILTNREIKKDLQILEKQIIDEQEVKNQEEKLKENILRIDEELAVQTKRVHKLITEFETQKTELEELEKTIAEIEKKKALKKLLQSRIKDHEEQIEYAKKIIQDFKPTNIKKPNIEDLDNKINYYKQKKEEINKKILDATTKLSKVQVRIESEIEKLNNIHSLNKCSVCLQPVTEEHKHNISKDVKTKNEEYKKKEDALLQYLAKAKKQLGILEENISVLDSKKRKANNILQEIAKEEQKLLQIKQQEEITKELQKKIKQFQEEVKKIVIEDIDTSEYESKKDKINELNEIINSAKIRVAELKKDGEHAHKAQKKLAEELKKFEKIKESITKKRNTRDWLEKYFLTTISNVEKNILLKIYSEFNSNFQEWFETLIEDDSITARLDESFSPYIIQNARTTTFNNLSGGEKTSMALAYRLALNKVIGDFMTNINTKDLMILDEPTDGFSSHQLDKLREVLDKIDNKQVIIVSHEQKLESYVDEIIRIEKSSHSSTTT